ncbi:uncharacterized protein EKO05_0009807 [Ascochyta rabiei]|uniref:uncharacterized protein n=1 Tax=Didymella rabiei TaxID=5454 RepID=UPI00220D50A8|nr:uncharacterized protein EKO05_0009807 [Ascochyta rabiei]UPX19547.1 hypothetical protein EKO05_0009807 [Ascochyta rabiei]
MATNTYYDSNPPMAQEQEQHLLAHSAPPSGHQLQQPPPLKSLHLAAHIDYHHDQASSEKFEDLQHAQQEDAHIKAHIRRFRILSRTLSFLISIGVLVPITMTLIKFLHTRAIHHDVTRADGTTISRTAWAKDSKAWPTYLYFSTAAVSALLDFSTLFSYRFGVSKANSASSVASVFSWVTMLGNLVMWCVAAGVYRNEKDKHGKSDDLWGWTCSAGARAIQKEFAGEFDFNRFCDVQSASWYVGLVQVAAGLLTLVGYVLVCRRERSKRRLTRWLAAAS